MKGRASYRLQGLLLIESRPGCRSVAPAHCERRAASCRCHLEQPRLSKNDVGSSKSVSEVRRAKTQKWRERVRSQAQGLRKLKSVPRAANRGTKPPGPMRVPSRCDLRAQAVRWTGGAAGRWRQTVTAKWLDCGLTLISPSSTALAAARRHCAPHPGH